MSPSPVNLLNYSPQALITLFAQWGEKSFRAKQVLHWVHQRGASDFSAMSDLAKDLRSKLQALAFVAAPQVISDHTSSDGTRKWLLDMGNGNAIETVFIPEDDRGTLCISTQAGCAVNCRFCSTGKQGFSRNLSTAEIIGQLWFAEFALRNDRLDQSSEKHPRENTRIISNVVLMGMGEPLLNFEPTVAALQLMLSDDAYGLSRRRVTLSTSGVVPMIAKLGEACPVALAVSLHAPNDALRNDLVPLNRKYPLAQLLAACKNYLQFAPRDFVTFEYCMLDGVNDTDQCAHELIAIAAQVPCKFNLIPFNPFPESGLKRSTPVRVKAFAKMLMDADIVTTVRKTRGDDIDAACGQLAGEVVDRTQVMLRMQRDPQYAYAQPKTLLPQSEVRA